MKLEFPIGGGCVVVLITPRLCGNGCNMRCAEAAADAINEDETCGELGITAETSHGRSFHGLPKESQAAIRRAMDKAGHGC